MPPRASIMTKLTAPTSVARSLTWSSERSSSASILNMVISKDRMDLMLANLPEFRETPQVLPPVRLESEHVGCEKILKPFVSSNLMDLVKLHEVCGFVVNWPVQKQGWCGVPCGNVIRVLDVLSEHQGLFTASRPICLWDPHRRCMDDDPWGRSSRYSQTPAYDFYRASRLQYETPYQNAFEVWDSFCREHWPEACEVYEGQLPEPDMAWQEQEEATPPSQAAILHWQNVTEEEGSPQLQACV